MALYQLISLKMVLQLKKIKIISYYEYSSKIIVKLCLLWYVANCRSPIVYNYTLYLHNKQPEQ